MMFKKQVLCALTALCTTSLFAAIPIESRGLSQGAQSNNISTQSAIATGADAPQTNTSWQLMQNQQLEMIYAVYEEKSKNKKMRSRD